MTTARCLTYDEGLALAHPAVLLTRMFAVRQATLCGLAQSAVWLGRAVTGLTLTLRNVDRFLLFTWAHRYLVPEKKIVYLAFAVICAASGR